MLRGSATSLPTHWTGQVLEHLMFRQAGGSFVGLSAASLCSVVTNGNGRDAGVGWMDLYLTRIQTVIYYRERLLTGFP